MKYLALTLAIAVASLTTSLAAHAGQIAQLNISGTDDIFAAGLPSVPNASSNGGQGNLPDELAIAGSEQFYVSAVGLVNCCDGSSVPPSTAAGFATNPFAGFSGSHITDSLAGSTVPGYDTSSGGIFALLYTFTNASGQDVGGLHSLMWGTSGYITAPSTATAMYFGFADGFGFNGPSGAYGDNFNSANAPGITLTVSTAPEPATWVLMILGVGLVGGALRLSHRQRLSPA